MSVVSPSVPAVLISGREACAELASAGVTERRARRALACGLAGTPIRTRGTHLYEAERVGALAERRVVGLAEMTERCSDGYFVSRRTLEVTADRADLLEELGAGYEGMSTWTRLSLWSGAQNKGGLPFVATVAGFVVLGAAIVDASGGRLVFAEPGDWFDGLADTQLLTGRGRTWTYAARWRLVA